MGKSLVTGIEIGHHSIKAVVLKPNKGTLALVDYHELPIETGIFSDNHMSNYQKIVKKLKELRKSLPRFSRKVAFAIPDNAVISKVIQIDSGYDDDEIEFAITQAFSAQSPFPTEEFYLDYVPQSEQELRFQVYATKKKALTERLDMFKQAGFHPVVVDSRCHALVHVWQLAARTLLTCDWLLVDVRSQDCSLCIDLPNQVPFCKEVALTRRAENGIGSEEALQWSNELIDAIQRSSQQIAAIHGISLAGIWLSGDDATTNLKRVIESQLDIPCQLLDPLNLVGVVIENQRQSSFGGHQFVLAAGAALRALTWLERDYAA